MFQFRQKFGSVFRVYQRAQAHSHYTAIRGYQRLIEKKGAVLPTPRCVTALGAPASCRTTQSLAFGASNSVKSIYFSIRNTLCVSASCLAVFGGSSCIRIPAVLLGCVVDDDIKLPKHRLTVHRPFPGIDEHLESVCERARLFLCSCRPPIGTCSGIHHRFYSCTFSFKGHWKYF